MPTTTPRKLLAMRQRLSGLSRVVRLRLFLQGFVIGNNTNVTLDQVWATIRAVASYHYPPLLPARPAPKVADAT